MKRRNADCGKLRRPMKRNKITEGMYGSTTVLYMKFLILWAIVMVADFMFMFRFEFLWPFWLLLRSVHDSFKYKGLAFSVLFVCIAITSDLVCLFFIPVHWLLFAASTYVWVQYVWHTDKGICLPTIILWMLFVYLEVGIRWKDSRHMPHLDLCRPFAAHCIGYPVVTLGFGFKSYVGYRMRQRKQREVAKENEFYMQLLQQALPSEETAEDAQASGTSATAAASVAVMPNGSATQASTTTAASSSSSSMSTVHVTSQANGTLATQAQTHHEHHHSGSGGGGSGGGGAAPNSGSSSSNSNHHHHHHHNNNNTHHSKDNSTSDSNATAAAATGASSPSASASSATSSALSSAATSKQGTASATSNGHIGGGGGGGGSRNHRRSMDKDKHRNKSDADNEHNTRHGGKNSNSSNYHQVDSGGNAATTTTSNNSKEKSDWDSSNGNYQQQQQHGAKDKHDKKVHNAGTNGNVPHCETDETGSAELAPVVVEKTKGRRNRGKKENANKDNHQQQQQQQHNNVNSNSNHKDSNHNAAATSAASNNNDASSVSSSASSTSASSTNAAAAALTQIASKVVSKICETCLKLEADVKKYRAEISHMKQIENELRQKLDANLTTKSCLQAKQKECDELEKRIQELNNARHADMLSLQNVERRLNEERRQKQSLDAQLSNEKKARKTAEEKAARPECSAQCKQRRQQMDDELKRLRAELKQADEAQQMAVEHGRKFEQEYRMLELKVRNRESSQTDAEMLMNALSAMQDKNSTLEKNLSAETRVKLDLFSALGVAKRQLEIADSHCRSKEDEVIDLKAKIAQLLAVMPDPLCLNTGPHGLRMNDTPPLQGGGPSSPMLSNLSAAQEYQQQQNQHAQQQQLQHQHQQHHQQQQQQLQQQQQQQQQQQVVPVSQQQIVPVSVAAALHVAAANAAANNGVSTLDPNATVYTPKTGNMMVAPVGMNPNGSDA